MRHAARPFSVAVAAAAVAALAWPACVDSNTAVVVISVEPSAQIPGVATMNAVVTAAGHTMTSPIPINDMGAAFAAGAARTFAVELPNADAGRFAIHLEVRDARSGFLAYGDGSTIATAGSRVDLTVPIGTCRSSKHAFCDDFESSDIDWGGWRRAGAAGASVAVDDTHAHSGRHGLHFAVSKVDVGNALVARISETAGLSSSALPELWVRTWVYRAGAPPPFFNLMSVQNDSTAQGAGAIVGFGGNRQTVYETDYSGPATTNASAPQGMGIAADRWTCVEWHLSRAVSPQMNGVPDMTLNSPGDGGAPDDAASSGADMSLGSGGDMSLGGRDMSIGGGSNDASATAILDGSVSQTADAGRVGSDGGIPGDNGSFEVFLDGTSVLAGHRVPNPAIWDHFYLGTTAPKIAMPEPPFDVWLDDVALDGSRIGCSPSPTAY